MSKNRSFMRRVTVWLMSGSFLFVGYLPMANAGVIGSQATINEQVRLVKEQKIADFLSQELVQTQFERLGVSSDQAIDRLSQLTVAELTQLEAEIDNAQAGAGALAVVGVVFVVLMVLEFVGVIDIFKRV